MLSQYLGGRSGNIHMLVKMPSPALETPQNPFKKASETHGTGAYARTDL